MSCKVGNQTNSQDPQAVNSRVFVGNLNTFQCSKTDVERRFQRYGRIAGISMHKGYAFIQFTNPFDARSACLGEDGRLLWGQTLDVNLVAEPKPHQTGRKRQNIAKTGNDWDYYYDSYYAQLGFPTPRLVPPMKRPRIHVPQTAPRSMPNNNKINSPNNKSYSNSNNTSLSELKSYSTPDILICGNCREMFTEVEQLMEHKKTYCKLRFTCKCHMLNGCKAKSPGEEPASLLCSQCKDSFDSAWDLMVHVQAAHMLNIYQLGADTNSKDQIEDIKDEDGVLCGHNGGGGNGFVGTLMSDIEERVGESQKFESTSSQLMMIGSSSCSSAVGSSPYSEGGILTSSSISKSKEMSMESLSGYKSDTMLSQFPTKQMNSGSTTSLVFPMEASTQTTTTDHPNNMPTNNFDEQQQHCGMLSSKTETSLLLTVANGQA